MIALLLALPLGWTNAADVDPASLREAAELARQTAATIRLDDGEVRRSRSVGLDGRSLTVSVDGLLQADGGLLVRRVRIEQVGTTEEPDCRERCGPVEPQKTLRRAYELDEAGNLLFVQNSADLVVPRTQTIEEPRRSQIGAEMIAKTLAAFHVASWPDLIAKNRRDGHRGYHSPAGETYALTSDNAAVELSLGGRSCGGVSIRMSLAPSAEAGQEGEVWQLCADDAGKPTELERSYARLDGQTVRDDHPSPADREYAARLLRYWLNRSRPF